jgi:hypothetical protein
MRQSYIAACAEYSFHFSTLFHYKVMVLFIFT